MQKFGDLLYMFVGIVLLGLTLSGAVDIGIWGILASIACIGFGLFRMYKMRQEGKALKSDLLQDGRVVNFYKATLTAWSSGKLASFSNSFQKEGKLTYDQLVKKYRPVEGSGLHVFFSQFPPKQGEFLVAVGNTDSSKNSGWFVLTNARLVQRDGRDNAFKEIAVADIESFEMKGTWTKTLIFKLKSGQTIDFEKVLLHPSEKILNEMIKQAQGGLPG